MSVEEKDMMGEFFGFTVARGTVNTTLGGLSVFIDMSNDVIGANKLNFGNCYDVYTPTFKPKIYVESALGYAIVAYPGRCGQILRITLPKTGGFKEYVNAMVFNFDLLNSHVELVRPFSDTPP